MMAGAGLHMLAAALLGVFMHVDAHHTIVHTVISFSLGCGFLHVRPSAPVMLRGHH
jgi:hypothetical protein